MTDELPVLDRSVVAELLVSVGGDEAFLHDLVATFLSEEPQNLKQVVAAASRGDAEAIIRPAHTLKSSSAVLGATRLSSISKQIEFAGREGRAADLTSLADEAQQAWAATVDALRGAGLTK